ncbi:hypothetical protein Lal_00000178 [Lupinus albus]|nr:hypothetical protein Lal_00000178 [Lupinus albus]
MKDKTTEAKSSRLTMPLADKTMTTARQLSWRKERKVAFFGVLVIGFENENLMYEDCGHKEEDKVT